jgi:hypothetical protein
MMQVNETFWKKYGPELYEGIKLARICLKRNVDAVAWLDTLVQRVDEAAVVQSLIVNGDSEISS